MRLGTSPVFFADRSLFLLGRQDTGHAAQQLSAALLMPSPTPLSLDRLRDLVLLYLAVGYGGEDSLATTEHDAIVELARMWAPDQQRETTEAIVDTAAVAARSGLGGDIDLLAQSLRPALPPAHRQRVLSDLAHVARADGVLSVAEASMIRRIRSAWGHA